MTRALIVTTSPNTWIELRILYESGNYPNLKALYDYAKDKFPDMPSMTQMCSRCADECWDKERFTEIKTELERRSMAELLAELGMDRKEQVKYRVKCVKAADELKVVISKLYNMLQYIDPNSDQFTETLGKIKVLTDTLFKGMNTSLAALQDISKLTGDYAPEKTKEIKSHGYKVGSGATAIEDMTEEEILQDLKRMKAAGIDLDEIEELKTISDEQEGTNEP